MKRKDLKELHYITPISNVPSILNIGILSHRKASKFPHESIAMQEVQDRRIDKVIPPGNRKLHDYVNLYICARNPMLYKRKEQHTKLCVLQVKTEILDIPGAIVTDRNASSDYVIFVAAPAGIEIIDHEWTFAEYWTDPNTIIQWEKKSAKCAEVLVPDCVALEFIMGAYVSCQQSRVQLENIGFASTITVDKHMFFL